MIPSREVSFVLETPPATASVDITSGRRSHSPRLGASVTITPTAGRIVTPPERNKLFLPLIAVAAVCVVQAIVIAYLLGRSAPAVRAAPDSAPGQQPVADAPASAVPQVNTRPDSPQSPKSVPKSVPPVARGKVGQRVESAGVALTVVAVTNEPRYKEVFAPAAGQKFVGVEVLLENTGNDSHKYFSTGFTLRDPQSRAYGGNALGVGDPPLGYGTLVPGEKVRGHLAFVVPNETTGLTLAYAAGDASSNDRPIYVELGQ